LAYDEAETKCELCITESSYGDYWIFGDAFMRGYYITHNYDTY